MPAAFYPEVTAQHEISFEAKEEVLSDRLDGQQRAPVQPLRNPGRSRARVWRLHFQALADERLQSPCSTAERVAFGHARKRMGSRTRSAAAGAVAATAWGLLEPLDRRLFRSDYSDVALLGKAVTRGRFWRPLGFAMHAANGAVFGLVYDEIRRRLAVDPRRLAFAMALVEHLALYPLAYFVDRYHPARGQAGVPPLLRSSRAFAQAGVRHALFGFLLGRLAAKA